MGRYTDEEIAALGDKPVDANEWVGADIPIRGRPRMWPLHIEGQEYLRRYSDNRRVGQLPELTGRGLIRSMAGQRRAIAEGQSLLEVINSYPSDDIRSGEPEHLEKALLQSGSIPGWQFPLGGLGPISDPDDGIEELEDGMVAWLTEQAPGTLITGLSYPRGTHKGYPFYTSDDGALLPLAIASTMAKTVDQAKEIGRHLALLLQNGSDTLEPWALMFTRMGPMRKQQPYFTVNDRDVPYISAMCVGTYARTRHVNAVATLLNMINRVNAVSFKHRLRSIDPCANVSRATRARDIDACRRAGMKVYSDDLTGYDKTFSRRLYSSVLRVWQRVAPEPATMEVYRWVSLDLGTLAPGWSPDANFVVIEKESGLPSGTVGTSSDGSLMNIMRVVKSVAAGFSWTVEDALRKLRAREWRLWVWGDDTLFAVPPGMDEDAYEQATERMGMKCKLSSAPVFLMTMYSHGQAPTNLASRTYAQSIWRERDHTHECVALFGLYTRFSLLRGHPLFDAAWTAVVRAAQPDGRLARRGIRSYSDLLGHIASDDFKKELQTALTKSAEDRKSILETLTRGSGDIGDVEPEARYALALLGQGMLSHSNWQPPARSGYDPNGSTAAALQNAMDNYMKLAEKHSFDNGVEDEWLDDTAPITGDDDE